MRNHHLPHCNFNKRIFALALFFLPIFLLFSQQNVGIIPAPQTIVPHPGVFYWYRPVLFFDGAVPNRDILLSQYRAMFGDADSVVKNLEEWTDNPAIVFQLHHPRPDIDNPDQAYTIQVKENVITIGAATAEGFFYGLQSLKQLYRYNCREWFDDQSVEIPCMDIYDYPNLQKRGWMVDISRGPIISMEYLKKQIQILSEFKLNLLTLYTENTFKSSTYDYAPADALTPEEIKELTEYARNYYVEVVGNQQCFAHFEKILSNPKYAYLADSKYNLNPAEPETYTFLENILDEEMQCYSSLLFNINCDETEALGTGNAKNFVKKHGAGNVYVEHILKVYDILKKRNRRTLMWGDIVLKDSTIMRKLPKDILMLVWSYGPADSFRGMIEPFRDAGYDFMVVPGVSMWSTVFPIMASYEKNICNMARDGYQLGAKGLINTAWNDSGEALVSSAWHALGWGAEMAWKPIQHTTHGDAENERNQRLSVFDTNFNFQFFHFYNNENIIADFIRIVSTYEQSAVPEIYNTSSLWNFQPLQFLPPQMTDEMLANLKQERFASMKTVELQKLILSEEAQYENSEQIYGAMNAASRLLVNFMLRRFQFYLYNYYTKPETATDREFETTMNGINDLTYYLQGLKQDYLHLWDLQYRNYWRDTVAQRYDRLISRLNEAPQQVFIETAHNGNSLEVTLRTLFNNIPIHYTLDGSEPTAQSPVYERPITLTQSCTVRTLTIGDSDIYRKFRNDSVIAVQNEKYILYHKGIGKLAQIDAQYSTYRAAYSGGGEQALGDGELGSSDYKDGHWQGYQGQDVACHLHFDTPTDIHSVTIRYLQNFNDWILAPEDVEIYTSKDGESYKPIRAQHFDIEQISGNRIGEIKLQKLKIKTQYLMVKVKNPGALPKEHAAAGSPSFIFMDEIIVQ